MEKRWNIKRPKGIRKEAGGKERIKEKKRTGSKVKIRA